MEPGVGRPNPRSTTRLLLFVRLVALPVAAFAGLGDPTFGNQSADDRRSGTLAVLGLAVVGMVIGTLWLRRVTSTAEDDERSWRYRDF